MQRKEIEKIYIDKIKRLKKYDRAYFEKDSPLVTDRDYDNKKNEILDLENKYKYLKHEDSPSKKVGYAPSS